MNATRARSGRRLITIPLLALVLVMGVSEVARADGRIPKPVSSTPSPNQNLKAAPSSVAIVFDTQIKFAGSDIVVYDKNGQEASIGPATVDKNTLKKLNVAIKGADNQVYVVVWHVVSADASESAVGVFIFGVNAKVGELSATPTTSSTSQVSGDLKEMPFFALLLGVLGLALGSVGGFMLGRRQRRKA